MVPHPLLILGHELRVVLPHLVQELTPIGWVVFNKTLLNKVVEHFISCQPSCSVDQTYPLAGVNIPTSNLSDYTSTAFDRTKRTECRDLCQLCLNCRVIPYHIHITLSDACNGVEMLYSRL